MSTARTRLVALSATSGLLLGGLALVGAASAAGVCPTYTDPAGDASYGQNVGTPDGNPFTNSDPDLDILDISHSVDAGVFSTVFHMTGINPTGPFFNYSDRFASAFTVNGKAATVTVDRDYTGSETLTGPVVEKGVLAVGGTATTAKVTVKVDVKASTITALISAEDMDKALGGALLGLPFSKMSSTATLTFPPVPVSRLTDTATAPATATYVFGGSCSGGDVPAPAPTATEEPEEEEEESEEPGEEEPSATPTPTGSEEPEEEEEESEEPAEAEGPPPLFDQPRTGCFLFKDAAGDAKPGRSPLSSPNNDDDLDLTEVALKSPADSLQVFAKVAKLGAAPTTPVFTGHSFTVALSVGGKAVTVTATKAGPATSNNAALKATAVFDTKASNVVFTLPKAQLETIAGGKLTDVTAITVTSNATNGAGSFDGDTATGAKPEEKTYAYGNNTCFQPPVGKLSLEGATSGVFSDSTTITATLVDTADAAVEGATVQLQLTGAELLKGVTNEDGEAVFTFPLTVKAGAKTLDAAFLGSATVGPAAAKAPFTVKAEKALLKAVAGRGTVTATLTDDDKTALAGQVVVFTVGSKVTKVKTNAKGVAVLTRQTKGATVKVSFAAVKDTYTAAPTVSAKVL